jgi:predicted branched-subunit amino acid permease
MPGMIAFGLAVGATAARKGFSFVESLAMNLFVYAGMSQLVAMEVWPERLTMAALGALALICATINARMLLISASLRPWLGAMPPWQIYPALHLTVDPGWLIAMRYRAEGGSDIGVFFGSSALLAFTWMSATSAGYFAGALVSDPRAFGIDLVMPVFFAAMLVPLWRGARRAVAWVIAGAVALMVQQFLGGWWFIVAGAVAGSVAGGFLDRD